MAAPTLLVQLSDPHVRDGEPVRDERLQRGVEQVLRLDPQPLAVLVTGDVADTPSAGEYARAREALAALPMPVHVLAGNHDDRVLLREAFGLPGAATDRIEGVATAGPLRIVLADTTIPGRPEGELDVGWLADRLTEDRTSPTVVAMHHPPLAIGVDGLDRIGLPRDHDDALAALLAEHPHVQAVVCGHVHRAAFAVVGGRAVVCAPSVNLQTELDFTGDELAVNDDPPGFVIHALVGSRLVSHVQPVS